MTKAELRSFEDLALMGGRRDTARRAVKYAADAFIGYKTSTVTNRGNTVYQATPSPSYVKRVIDESATQLATNPLFSQSTVPNVARPSEVVSNEYIPQPSIAAEATPEQPIAVSYPETVERSNDPDAIRRQFADVLNQNNTQNLDNGAK
jgi:hypothetical protein